MTEEWRDIDGYEGLYQVSSLGRIRSLDRTIIQSNGKKRFYKGKILALTDAGKGYRNVPLSKNGKHSTPRVCRIVAQAFCTNPYGYNQVNHKDEDKANDRADNLEWCTPKYNTNYGTGIQRRAKTISIPVDQYTLDGQFVKRWDGIKIAANALNIHAEHISHCCKGRLNQTGGYKWQYASKDDNGAIVSPESGEVLFP